MGRAPLSSNLWVATGFNSLGIQTGPGVGLAMADWMVHNEPGRSLKVGHYPQHKIYTIRLSRQSSRYKPLGGIFNI